MVRYQNLSTTTKVGKTLGTHAYIDIYDRERHTHIYIYLTYIYTRIHGGIQLKLLTADIFKVLLRPGDHAQHRGRGGGEGKKMDLYVCLKRVLDTNSMHGLHPPIPYRPLKS